MHFTDSRLKPSFFLALLSLLAISLAGCANVHGTLVAPEIESPYMAGGWDVGVHFSESAGRQTELFTDASNRPPLSPSDLVTSSTVSGITWSGLDLTLPAPVSISGGTVGVDALIDGLWAGGKLQFLGNQGLIKQNSLLLSAYARAGYSRGTDSGDKNGEFGVHGFPWQSTRSGNFHSIGLSAGFLFTEKFLVFAGYGTGASTVTAEIFQSPSTDGSNAGGTYKNDFKADTDSFGTGIQYAGQAFQANLGFQRSRFKFTDRADLYESTFLLRFDFPIHHDHPSQSENSVDSRDR